MALNVGDKVKYVPDISLALNRLATREFLWSFRWKDNKGVIGDILSDDEVEDQIRWLRTTKGKGHTHQLIRVAPKVYLDATVTAVNADGTVNLDIQHCIGGVTLHCAHIPVDEVHKMGHTCH